jgi:hypothetical protein
LRLPQLRDVDSLSADALIGSMEVLYKTRLRKYTTVAAQAGVSAPLIDHSLLDSAMPKARARVRACRHRHPFDTPP